MGKCLFSFDPYVGTFHLKLDGNFFMISNRMRRYEIGRWVRPDGRACRQSSSGSQMFLGFRISMLQIHLGNVLVQKTPRSGNLDPSTFLPSLHGGRQPVLFSPCGFGTYCRERTSGILDSSGWLVAKRDMKGGPSYILLRGRWGRGGLKTSAVVFPRRGQGGDGPGTGGVRWHAP